jgi:hypothetical protein
MGIEAITEEQVEHGKQLLLELEELLPVRLKFSSIYQF